MPVIKQVFHTELSEIISFETPVNDTMITVFLGVIREEFNLNIHFKFLTSL
jgi:hypothetical protein